MTERNVPAMSSNYYPINYLSESRQPPGLAFVISVVIHGVLGITVPMWPLVSKTIPDNQRTVGLVELSPEQQKRLPLMLSPQQTPQIPAVIGADGLPLLTELPEGINLPDLETPLQLPPLSDTQPILGSRPDFSTLYVDPSNPNIPPSPIDWEKILQELDNSSASPAAGSTQTPPPASVPQNSEIPPPPPQTAYANPPGWPNYSNPPSADTLPWGVTPGWLGNYNLPGNQYNQPFNNQPFNPQPSGERLPPPPNVPAQTPGAVAQTPPSPQPWESSVKTPTEQTPPPEQVAANPSATTPSENTPNAPVNDHEAKVRAILRGEIALNSAGANSPSQGETTNAPTAEMSEHERKTLALLHGEATPNPTGVVSEEQEAMLRATREVISLADRIQLEPTAPINVVNVYPPQACSQKLEGRALVVLPLNGEGEAIDGGARLLLSTGNDILDRAARAAVIQGQVPNPQPNKLNQYAFEFKYDSNTCNGANAGEQNRPPVQNSSPTPSSPPTNSVTPTQPPAPPIAPTNSASPTQQPATQPETKPAEPEQPAATQTEPEQPEATQAEPEQPETKPAEPEQPAETQTEPEQPAATQTEPEQPAATQTEPEQPAATQAEPEQPAATQAEPEQPAATQTEPEQPSESSNEPEEDAPESSARPTESVLPALQ